MSDHCELDSEGSPQRPAIQTRRSTTSTFTITADEAEYIHSQHLDDGAGFAHSIQFTGGSKVAFEHSDAEEDGNGLDGSPRKRKKRKHKKKNKEQDVKELYYYRELSTVVPVSPDAIPDAAEYEYPDPGDPSEEDNGRQRAFNSKLAMTSFNGMVDKQPGSEKKYKMPQVEEKSTLSQVVRRNTTVSIIKLTEDDSDDLAEGGEAAVDRAGTSTSLDKKSVKSEVTPVKTVLVVSQASPKKPTTLKENPKPNSGVANNTEAKPGDQATTTAVANGETSAESGQTEGTGAVAGQSATDTGCCARVLARIPCYKKRTPGGPFPVIWKNLKSAPGKLHETVMGRKWLFGVIFAVFFLIMFLILFPISFVYVPYHEIALLRTKSTGKIHRDQTYYPGCYVQGPDAEFVYTRQSANIVSLTLSVFTFDRLELDIEVSYSYFIRPEELGQLDEKYGQGYDSIFENMATTTVKNEFIRFSLEELLKERARVERELHLILYQRLGGTCCLKCCIKEGCVGPHLNHLCTDCDSSTGCKQGEHVEVKYFQLGLVDVPTTIANQLLTNIILKEQEETAVLQQSAEKITVESRRQIQAVLNQATEITQAGVASSSRITAFADADSDVVTQGATFTGWDSMATRLSIMTEQHKLSLLLINKLSKMDNLVIANNYNASSRVGRN